MAQEHELSEVTSTGGTRGAPDTQSFFKRKKSKKGEMQGCFLSPFTWPKPNHLTLSTALSPQLGKAQAVPPLPGPSGQLLPTADREARIPTGFLVLSNHRPLTAGSPGAHRDAHMGRVPCLRGLAPSMLGLQLLGLSPHSPLSALLLVAVTTICMEPPASGQAVLAPAWSRVTLAHRAVWADAGIHAPDRVISVRESRVVVPTAVSRLMDWSVTWLQ